MSSISLLLLLDLTGTFVFALSGGLLAVRKDLDVVGIVVLSVATGLGGGVLRDVLLGRTPPAALERESYLAAAVAAAAVVYFFSVQIERMETPLQRFDALGLGLFAVSGTLTS
ncbi:MAG: TRIC cation channel family protein, partial [Chloroflexota bacterium]|nr:TRIC cation channel family protein [Chloroflexota bacterium]